MFRFRKGYLRILDIFWKQDKNLYSEDAKWQTDWIKKCAKNCSENTGIRHRDDKYVPSL